MHNLFFMLMPFVIAICAGLIFLYTRKPKADTWQEPTDCDNNFCDCASLAHPADVVKVWPNPDAIKAKKVTKSAKKATKKPAKKVTMRKKKAAK